MRLAVLLTSSAQMLFAALLVPAIAIAGVLDITGAYGNEAGCRYAATNEYGDDRVIVLTSETYETAATFCEFLQALPAKDGSKVLTMLCGHEGESTQTIDFMRVAQATDVGNAYDVFDAVGNHQGTLNRCP